MPSPHPRITLVAIVLLAGMVLAAAEKKPGRDLSKQKLEKFDYSKEDLENATFESSNLRFATFADAYAAGANFRKADLTSTSFNRAKLMGADFRGCKAENASFQSTDLTAANFEGTKLVVSFQSSILHRANLKGVTGITDVTKTDFTGAELQGADLSEAKDYGPNSAIFTDAKYDSKTRFPAGVDKAKCGAILVKDEVAVKPEPMPEPKPLPESKPEPKPMDDGQGGELKYGKASLKYAKSAGAAEAKRLGDFLVKEVMFGESALAAHLEKDGATWVLRLAASKDQQKDADYHAACKELAALIAKGVFGDAKVEIHICDGALKTVKVVTGS